MNILKVRFSDKLHTFCKVEMQQKASAVAAFEVNCCFCCMMC